MKKTISIGALFLGALVINAQSYDHESWKLSKNTTMDSVNLSDVKDYPYHYSMYKEIEQIFINKETNKPNKFHAVHAKVHINSAKGVDKFKSLYQSGSKEFFQYRIVKANGEVLDKNDEKEDNTTETYRIDIANFDFSNLDFSKFLGGDASISGLDTNCQLEYIYVTKKTYINDGDLYGVDFIQDEVPIYKYEYQLITSDNLHFKLDGFNGCPASDQDESDDKNYELITIDKVEAFHKSAIIATGANKVGFLYVLHKNDFHSKTERIFKYSNYSKFYFETYMKEDKANEKLVKKYLNKKEELTGKKGLERLQFLEATIKDEIKYSYSNADLSSVVKNRTANSKGKLKLYCSILNYWGEKYEFVFSTSRRYIPFLTENDNYVYLDNLLVYFPEYDVYLDPSSRYNYIDLIPSAYRETRAIFTKKIGVNDFSSGTHYIDSVKPLAYQINFFTNDIQIDLQKENAVAKIKSNTGGMTGLSYWNTLKDINYESREDFFTGLSKIKYPDAILANGDFLEIDKYKSPLNTPVTFDYQFSANSLISKQKDKIEVNIGGFINDAKGLQEKPKGNYAPDIYSGYLKTKTITINLPAGYTVANTKDLEVKKSFASGGDANAMEFNMSHKIEGNKLVLTITEKMGRGMFTPADMDNFLEVYNTAWNLKDLKVDLVKK